MSCCFVPPSTWVHGAIVLQGLALLAAALQMQDTFALLLPGTGLPGSGLLAKARHAVRSAVLSRCHCMHAADNSEPAATCR